jgi:hypothetical protein
MDDQEIRGLDRAERTATFFQENALDFAPGSKASLLATTLGTVIHDLREAGVGQRRAPVGKEARIQALSEDFKDIARTSRSIIIDEPDFPAALYRHPGKYTEEPITTHADALLQLLEDQATDTPEQLAGKAALRAKFIAYEMPADFVEDLRADRDALAACNTGKHSDNQKGVESTAAIDTLLAQAQDIVTRLDAAVRNKYKNNPDKLAAWKSASHLQRPARKPKTPAPVTP